MALHDDLLHVEHLGAGPGQRAEESARDSRTVVTRHRDAQGVDVGTLRGGLQGRCARFGHPGQGSEPAATPARPSGMRPAT